MRLDLQTFSPNTQFFLQASTLFVGNSPRWLARSLACSPFSPHNRFYPRIFEEEGRLFIDAVFCVFAILFLCEAFFSLFLFTLSYWIGDT